MTSKASWEDLVTIGEVARSHGRWGDVIVNPVTDFPERFRDLERVYVKGELGQAVALRIEGAREHRGRVVVRLGGVSSIDAADALAGQELRIPESELVRLPKGCLFHFQLIGCSVWDRLSGNVGVVEAVMQTGGTDILVVRGGSEQERLIPLCKDICRDIDIEKRRIEIDAPEGLLGLNAR